ncbi:MAG: protein kinase [Sandaracinaceae bacterium]|nr:protein kinase [Sandaracinaceae bacterium]
MTSSAPGDRVGTTLAGKYELVRLLGVGGSGAVYEASHQRTGARYAIKLLLPSADRAEAERMLREARALAKLEHEHIVRLVDLDEDSEGELYLVEELLRGRTLRALLDEELLLPAQRALELTVPILRALGYAHARGIVHRDLKPENIFLCEDDAGRVTPKLLDFGLVREGSSSGGTTRPGTLLGTPRYMSPEQAWGRDDLDGRSDLWSLAVVLYECLSGVSPFEGPNDRAVLASIVTAEPPHLRSAGVAVDDALADAVMLALTRAPEARVPSAAVWEEALGRITSFTTEPWYEALFPRRAPLEAPAQETTPPARATPSAETSAAGERRTVTLVVSMLAIVAIVTFSWVLVRGGAADRDTEPSASMGSRAGGSAPTASQAASSPAESPPTDPHAPSRYTDTHETDTHETDSRETDTHETGNPETGNPETDTHETGNPETGNPETDSHETDSHETGNPETGTPETDSHETGNPETGTHETDIRTREASLRAGGARTTGTSAGSREGGGVPMQSHESGADDRGMDEAPPTRSAGPNAAPLVDEL